MNKDATAKIVMLEGSMRCFVFGLIGLIPLIGLPFAVLALWNGGRVRAREKIYWNIAKPYRMWGVIFAGLGTVFTVLAAILITYNTVTGSWNND
jgi:hypothetical protein